MISQTAEYALRAVVALAQHGDQPQVTPDIARVTRVPAGYLAKVLQALARAELVRSQRGLGGGFTLARAAAEITVLEVINAVDPIKRILRCPLGIVDHGGALCPLHRMIDGAIEHTEQVFGRYSIQDLISIATPSVALCDCAVDSPATAPLRMAATPASGPAHRK